MNELQRLSELATRLHQEEPDLTFAPVPWHARNTLCLDAHAYYLWPCGKGFRDITSKRQHQIWCKTPLGNV